MIYQPAHPSTASTYSQQAVHASWRRAAPSPGAGGLRNCSTLHRKGHLAGCRPGSSTTYPGHTAPHTAQRPAGAVASAPRAAALYQNAPSTPSRPPQLRPARAPKRARLPRPRGAGARLVLLGDGHDAGQVHHLALHAVDALHHDEHLAPGPPRARLPLRDRRAQHRLQVVRVVVREHLRAGRRGLFSPEKPLCAPGNDPLQVGAELERQPISKSARTCALHRRPPPPGQIAVLARQRVLIAEAACGRSAPPPPQRPAPRGHHKVACLARRRGPPHLAGLFRHDLASCFNSSYNKTRESWCESDTSAPPLSRPVCARPAQHWQGSHAHRRGPQWAAGVLPRGRAPSLSRRSRARPPRCWRG